MESKEAVPYFSIIVPIYNVNLTYFAACMESILQQSCSDFEVILVDDGSNTECALACDQYAKKDKRVRVIHQENQGVSAARNHGIEAATADWIMFVDADDWIEQNTCAELKKNLGNVDCDILLFNAVKEFAEKQERMNYGLVNETLYKMDDIDIREMLYSRAMGSPNTKAGRLCVIYYSWDKVYKRAFLIDNNIQYPVGIPKSEDKIFILQCFEKLHSLYYIDFVLYHYRINVESVCNRYSERADLDRIILSEQLETIAERMDAELGKKRGKKTYRRIKEQFYRFTFGIISDVLKLKYFHPDYPYGKKVRNIEVKNFLRTEPFRSSISNVKYKELPTNAKIKKFMLSHNMAKLFYNLKEAKSNYSGKTAAEIATKEN